MNAVVARSNSHPFGILQMSDVSLVAQRVLIRVDFNVPLCDGRVVADYRIRACLPTIHLALKEGAAVILMSHLGRPEEGRITPELSLAPVAQRLEELLNQPVRLVAYDELGEVGLGEVVLLENIRFSSGEKCNEPQLAMALASLGDVFVMDAFGCAHRKHASTYGVVQFAKTACAGPLLYAEIEAISHVTQTINHPVVAVVGGSKISTKLGILNALCDKVDCLVPGGGIANTLLATAGYDVGASLSEPDDAENALRLQENLHRRGARLLLPEDVVCAASPESYVTTVRRVDEVSKDEMILDIGPCTCEQIEVIVKHAATIFWNGPVGMFEQASFAEGTRRLAQAVAASEAYSVVGGGDTLAALDQFGVGDDISYISTGGGAMLEFIEKGDLPAVAALRSKVVN